MHQYSYSRSRKTVPRWLREGQAVRTIFCKTCGYVIDKVVTSALDYGAKECRRVCRRHRRRTGHREFFLGDEK